MRNVGFLSNLSLSLGCGIFDGFVIHFAFKKRDRVVIFAYLQRNPVGKSLEGLKIFLNL